MSVRTFIAGILLLLTLLYLMSSDLHTVPLISDFGEFVDGIVTDIGGKSSRRGAKSRGQSY